MELSPNRHKEESGRGNDCSNQRIMNFPVSQCLLGMSEATLMVSPMWWPKSELKNNHNRHAKVARECPAHLSATKKKNENKPIGNKRTLIVGEKKSPQFDYLIPNGHSIGYAKVNIIGVSLCVCLCVYISTCVFSIKENKGPNLILSKKEQYMKRFPR